jgi:hypothetical protein
MGHLQVVTNALRVLYSVVLGYVVHEGDRERDLVVVPEFQ